jgi:membrane associated rhomboid family serine protease
VTLEPVSTGCHAVRVDDTPPVPPRGRKQRDGLLLLGAILAFMWLIEVINTLDSNRLDGDGLHARDVGRAWGILTAPFIHASFQHLLANSIALVFMGVIIALRGAQLLARVTVFVIVLGGIGVWLISPSHETVAGQVQPVVTIGASGLVFGYAAYLFARGFFERSLLDLFAGLVVGLVWGTTLLSSLEPHGGISWQAHACGGIAGVLAAYAFSDRRRAQRSASTTVAGT